jgi:sensor histidine kinase YesM
VLPQIVRSVVKALYENRGYRFWACQLVGWSGYSLVTFFSITLLDANFSLPHVAHIALQAVLGILASWPLRPIYRYTFSRSIRVRVLVAVLAIVVASAIWTALRLVTFMAMSGEVGLWQEFNYWYFGSLFVFLSWTVLYYAITYYELFGEEHQKLVEQSILKEREHRQRLQAEYTAREAQLRMLRYQLNPHFLFNTLNAINALVRLDENEKARRMLQGLSAFLRHSLEESDVHDVSLDMELKSLMLYLDIEKARFADRLVVELDIDPQARDARVPGLILQPLVENAMKYAIDPSENGGTVRVCAQASEDTLSLEVSDTGPGIEALDTDMARGVGLRNTLERLGTLYGERYTFSTVNRDPTGLSVKISLPYEKRGEA